jgi:pimeloyl-ACP methyl ester carboxylesterase
MLANYSQADRVFEWQGHSIGFVAVNQEKSELPAVLLIHGFGASVGHWRKNIPALSEVARVYAIDLIGFGASAKPPSFAYTFENWGQLVADFISTVIGTPVILVGNSIGAIVALQATVDRPDLVKKAILINCSLRLLHESKQKEIPWYRSWGSRFLQSLLANRSIALLFFNQVRQPQAVRRILQQAYQDRAAITEELIQILLKPAGDPHAVDVFMAFVRYSQGPTPEELLAKTTIPVTILWGDRDPWEPIALGQKFRAYPCVKEFVTIAGAGHCPQDEAPQQVNPILTKIISGDSSTDASPITSPKNP